MKRFIFTLLGVFCVNAIVVQCQAQTDTIITVAGNGVNGDAGNGGLATLAAIGASSNVVFDHEGNYYFSQRFSNNIRKVTPDGIISDFAGTGVAGYFGDNGLAISAKFNNPCGIAIDNNDNLYIADAYNYVIRKINLATDTITTYAGNGIALENGDGGLATAASIYYPQYIYVDNIGNIYMSDQDNKVRKVDVITNIITTVAGKGGAVGFSGDSGPADSAQLNGPQGICTDTAGNLFIADYYNDRIRKVDAVTGIITTIAGGSLGTYNGEGIPAASAQLNPFQLVFDAYGNLYIADTHNRRIRKIDNVGNIYTVAGNGIMGYSGDCGPADSAELDLPFGIGFDSLGSLYINDAGPDYRIRKLVTNINHSSVSISTTSESLCSGTVATYSATVTAGAGISYNWYINGIPTGATTSSTYTYTPANGDSIRCVLAGISQCSGATDTVSSNTITMVVTPPATPTITVAGPAMAAAGSIVTVTATVAGAGSSYGIHWYNGGVLFNTTTTPVVTYTKSTGTDLITATIVPTGGCYDSATAAAITIATTGEGVSTVVVPQAYVYPNPAHTGITVIGQKINSVTISNLLGQTLLTQQCNTSTTTVNIEVLPPGVYVLELSDNDGIRTVKKIVKE